MKRVLCYGDSNTFGTGPMRALSDDPIHPKALRWAGVMAGELGAKYDVVVEGLPGRTTVWDDPVEGEYRNGLRSLRATLESHRPIDLLILLLGTNDTKHRFGLGPQDIALGVSRLVPRRWMAWSTRCSLSARRRCAKKVTLPRYFAGQKRAVRGCRRQWRDLRMNEGRLFWTSGR